MKLVGQNKSGWKYQMNPREGDCLRSLLQQFPITADTHAKISNSDTDPETVEREKLLNESLAEHRKDGLDFEGKRLVMEEHPGFLMSAM